jgi:poly-gamma-glutamate capsule biosynthesis protein CapA/YwtB (metallophosphatase superfamily)
VPRPLTLAAVGQARILRDLRGDASPGLAAALAAVRAADVAFTNLETSIWGRHGGWPFKNGFPRPPGPEVLDSLRWMGFGVLSLANNHVFDLGPPGILSTLEQVKARGFVHAGIGEDLAGASLPGIADTPAGRVALVAMDSSPQPDFFYAADARGDNPARPGINRLKVLQSLRLPPGDYDRLAAIAAASGHAARRAERERVGFGEAQTESLDFYGTRVERGDVVAEGRVLDPADLERNLGAVRRAAAEADFVLVYEHHHLWGARWEEPPRWIRELARLCVDAGASAFVSHGVPVLQGIEIYKRRPIFYSLGNFVFHSHRRSTYANPWIWRSLVATCAFDARGDLEGVDLLPVVIGGAAALADESLPRESPHAVGGAEAALILERVAALSSELGTRVEIAGERGRIAGPPRL